MEQVESNKGFTAASNAACVGAADFATGAAALAEEGDFTGVPGFFSGVDSAAINKPAAKTPLIMMQTLRRMRVSP
jgi:hypothetical protein